MTTTPRHTIVVATDGSCIPTNPGPGGWAWITPDGRSATGSTPHTTNNIMELTAIKQALIALPDPLHILSDSRYCIDALTIWCKNWERDGWHTASGKPVKNRELIATILKLLKDRDVTFQHIRAHNGHTLNEQADALANQAALSHTPLPARSKQYCPGSSIAPQGFPVKPSLVR